MAQFLSGVSAGSICWFIGGTTDSFGPELKPVNNGLALLPYANGVHYDSEAQRRPLLQSLISNGTFETAFATDDHTGIVFKGIEPIEVLSDIQSRSKNRTRCLQIRKNKRRGARNAPRRWNYFLIFTILLICLATILFLPIPIVNAGTSNRSDQNSVK
jgi:hypothetical protein